MPAGSPAQQFLPIEAVREDVVIMKDGGLRVVLMCSSLNLALKSADEQDAIIFNYQNFLNSLDFGLQFVIHSRRLNIEPYLEALRDRQKEEVSELLKIQVAEYAEFVRSFVESTSIMSKQFYAVVPFTPPLFEQPGLGGNILSVLGFGSKEKKAKPELFEEHKNQLWQRTDTVISGLQRFGIRSAPLNTEELIELFYGLYNPTEFEKTISPAENQ